MLLPVIEKQISTLQNKLAELEGLKAKNFGGKMENKMLDFLNV